MKKKSKKKKKIRELIFAISFAGLFLFIIFISLPQVSEPHFKIYKNESGELIEDNIIGWCYSKDDCGKIRIGEKPWEIEWLDMNCECIRNCEYVFNVSKREKFKVEDSEEFIAKTYEGLIWFTIDEEGNEIVEYYQGDVELVEKCNPCQRYKCGEYMVEVWNQIK